MQTRFFDIPFSCICPIVNQARRWVKISACDFSTVRLDSAACKFSSDSRYILRARCLEAESPLHNSAMLGNCLALGPLATRSKSFHCFEWLVLVGSTASAASVAGVSAGVVGTGPGEGSSGSTAAGSTGGISASSPKILSCGESSSSSSRSKRQRGSGPSAGAPPSSFL